MWTGLKTITLFSLLVFFFRVPSAPCSQETPDQEKAYLQKITQESSNPVGELWMITNQFNLNLEQSSQGQSSTSSGQQTNKQAQAGQNSQASGQQSKTQVQKQNFEDPRPQFNYNFQPVLKFDLNSDWRFLTRPVIPIYNSPSPKGRTSVDYTFGLGDIELKGILSPNSKGPGFKWGIGPSAVFPTATASSLGNGKWQLGGAMTALYMNDKWVVGMFPEHWWSVGGDPTRQEVSLTKVQYFIWYSPIPTWQVGMIPTVTIDWLQPKSENALTLPVGLGVSKTVLLGKIPVKFIVEADYAVVRPRGIPGDEWTFKFSIIPIIPALF